MEQTTKQFRKRNAILACLQSTDAHPSAEWIYHRLKPQIPDLSLGTVYRNLTLFKDQGLAVSLGTVRGVERFDGNTQPHVHFICTSCDAVRDMNDVEIPPALTRSASAFGQVAGCQLTFTGRCRECIVKEEAI